jgi:glycosyltransferase involved in cell wall biosynthesis
MLDFGSYNKMTKKAGIYDPYLDTLGGGERYCLTVAEILLKNGYSVDIFWSGNSKIIDKAQERFSLDLKKVKLVPDIFEISPHEIERIHDNNFLLKLIQKTSSKLHIREKLLKIYQKFQITRKYDLVFFLSDGSNPFLFSKKNILHIQVPFLANVLEPQPLIEPIKSLLFSNIICNSQFTSRFVKKYFHKKIDILYPPVDIAKFTSDSKKENIILSVGRFDNILNAKKQDCLIDAFSHLVKKNHLNNWKLILAGGSIQESEKNSFLQLLIKKAEGLPIEFVINPNFDELQKIYSISKIYWHAAGFQVDENCHPEETEHFGMTIVEAMASGLVPFGVNKGGIPEIIDNTQNGFLWKTIKGLSAKTLHLIKDPQLLDQISQNAIQKAKQFSKENFETEFIKLLKLS